MKTFFLQNLEKYLRRESLSSFLPASKDKTLFSITALLLVCVCVAAITKLYDKSFWIGFSIPLIVLAIYMFMIIIYLLIRIIAGIISSKGNYDSNLIMSYINSNNFGAGVIIIFLVVTPIIVGIYISSWLSALIVIGVLLVVLVFSGTFLFNRDYLILSIIEIVVQVFRGWALSWQAVLATTPLLLVAILLSLFSGDLWILLGKISIAELTILITFMYIPVFFAVFAKIDLTDLISHRYLISNENIVDRVFGIPFIRKLKDENLLSIEDRDDTVSILKWRSLDRAKELIANRLERRIQWWYLLVIILTCSLLDFSFFIIFLILFFLISQSLLQMGWLLPAIAPNFINDPIPNVASFLASIQVAAFAASLLEKPKDNILFKRTLEKAVDWISAIIVFQALYLPDLQMWESKEEAPWHKKFGVTALRGKIVVHETATDEEVNKSCEKMEEFYPRVQLIDFSIYRKDEKLFEKMRFGVEDFQWKYIHNRKVSKKQFTPIPYELVIQEQHLLGREKLLTGEEIPTEWFGNNRRNSETGRTIWESDEKHEVIMHPCVFGDDDKALLISINLFRKFPASSDYSSLAHKLLGIIRQKNPQAKMITINLYFRSILFSNVIADLQWHGDDLIFYKDELQKKGNILTPIFSLFFKIRSRQKRKKGK